MPANGKIATNTRFKICTNLTVQQMPMSLRKDCRATQTSISVQPQTVFAADICDAIQVVKSTEHLREVKQAKETRKQEEQF